MLIDNLTVKRVVFFTASALLFGMAPRVVMTQATLPTFGYTVVRSYPHDAGAFTQGLEYVDGVLYESTGLNGRSSVRKVKLETGEVVQKRDIARAAFRRRHHGLQVRIVRADLAVRRGAGVRPVDARSQTAVQVSRRRLGPYPRPDQPHHERRHRISPVPRSGDVRGAAPRPRDRRRAAGQEPERARIREGGSLRQRVDDRLHRADRSRVGTRQRATSICAA